MRWDSVLSATAFSFGIFVFISSGRENNDTTYVLLNGDFGYLISAFKDCNFGPNLNEIFDELVRKVRLARKASFNRASARCKTYYMHYARDLMVLYHPGAAST